MDHTAILLVTAYDGGGFAGWQRQPEQRTVQGEMERVLARLCDAPVSALAAGRTDAGVHARGQGVGVRVPPTWTPVALRRAMNALLPVDIRVVAAHAMVPDFHPRFDARARRYRYVVGLGESAFSPFRRRWVWAYRGQPLDVERLRGEAAALPGEHVFRAFAVANTAPAHDEHRCRVLQASWQCTDDELVFDVEANRFLHHMVRFLVGTMIEVAAGRRPEGTIARLLTAEHNAATAAPAPPEGLFFEAVRYDADRYLAAEADA